MGLTDVQNSSIIKQFTRETNYAMNDQMGRTEMQAMNERDDGSVVVALLALSAILVAVNIVNIALIIQLLISL